MAEDATEHEWRNVKRTLREALNNMFAQTPLFENEEARAIATQAFLIGSMQTIGMIAHTCRLTEQLHAKMESIGDEGKQLMDELKTELERELDNDEK
jgi:hypothetical protein